MQNVTEFLLEANIECIAKSQSSEHLTPNNLLNWRRTNHLGLLSLVTSLWVGALSTSKR